MLDLAHRGQLFQAFEAVRGPLVNGKYLHWDELRRRPAPKGLSHEQWWIALKTARLSFAKEVPLADAHGRPFRFSPVDPIPEHVHRIDMGAGGRIEMPDEVVNAETKDRYYIGSLIEEAITSSQLEGAATTRQVAREMIRSGRKPQNRSERMILNNFRTMRRIGELRDEPLARELVLEIHELVTRGTLDGASAAGHFRRPNERVVVSDPYGEIMHEPPPADELQQRMDLMCRFANGSVPEGFIHPAIRAIILHFWLAYDHPFVDGNGRTARALFYWSMLRSGFWLFEFISVSPIIVKAPVRYGRAFLFTETDQNDLTYFVLYHLDVIERAIGELHTYIRRKSEQVKAVDVQLQGSSVLNYRQRALIGHALRHPHFRYTIQSHREAHNVVYETARSDLMELAELGLVERMKIHRKWFFVPVERLDEALSILAQARPR